MWEEAASEAGPEMCQLSLKEKTQEATGTRLCGQGEHVCGLETKTEFIKHLCWGYWTCNCASPQSLGGVTLCLIRGHVPLTERLEPGRLVGSVNPDDLITHH